MVKLQNTIKFFLPMSKKCDLSEFRAWFEEFDAETWDKQFEEDASSGKLDKLANQAISDFKAGKCKEL